MKFEVESSPAAVHYTPIAANTPNDGVYDSVLGRDVNTLHNPFVDDNIIADIQPWVLTVMGASIEALFITLGELCGAERRSHLSMDEFADLLCSWRKQ